MQKATRTSQSRVLCCELRQNLSTSLVLISWVSPCSPWGKGPSLHATASTRGTRWLLSYRPAVPFCNLGGPSHGMESKQWGPDNLWIILRLMGHVTIPVPLCGSMAWEVCRTSVSKNQVRKREMGLECPNFFSSHNWNHQRKWYFPSLSTVVSHLPHSYHVDDKKE